SDKNVIPPYGVAGGRSGYPNRFIVLRDGKEIQPSPIPGKVSGFDLIEGDIVRIETAGGGGYGDPLKRDYARIERDCRQGYLSPEQARARYGAVLHGLKVDREASDALRGQLLAARKSAPIRIVQGDAPAPARRKFRLSERILSQSALSAG